VVPDQDSCQLSVWHIWHKQGQLLLLTAMADVMLEGFLDGLVIQVLFCPLPSSLRCQPLPKLHLLAQAQETCTG
jgi:hypothetical protein